MQYYHNVEMSKLTDSEGEYWPADDEWIARKAKAAKQQPSTAPASQHTAAGNMDRLNSFLDA